MTHDDVKALKVGPDEVLVLVVDDQMPPEVVESLLSNLLAVGLEGRAIVVQGKAEMAAVKREAALDFRVELGSKPILADADSVDRSVEGRSL